MSRKHLAITFTAVLHVHS